MANFVEIKVGVDSWSRYFFEVPDETGWPASADFTLQVDEDFLREYRKSLDVVYRFQEFVAKEIKNAGE